jgi:hypothetical protein
VRRPWQVEGFVLSHESAHIPLRQSLSRQSPLPPQQ